MAQKETLLADDLRQRLELLELRFDQKKAAYTWEVRRVCWGGVSFDERSNLFSSVGIGARGASIVIRPDQQAHTARSHALERQIPVSDVD